MACLAIDWLRMLPFLGQFWVCSRTFLQARRSLSTKAFGRMLASRSLFKTVNVVAKRGLTCQQWKNLSTIKYTSSHEYIKVINRDYYKICC